LQRRFHTLDTDEIETLLRVDLITPIVLARLLLPQMLERGYGRIVNISAIAGRVGFPFTEAYAASKDGLIAFSRVLRNDYRGADVSASAIVLGAVRGAGLGQRTLDETGLKANTAFMVKPDKVARAVVRAIERDKAEIVVMAGPGRLMKALMDLFPGFGSAISRFRIGSSVLPEPRGINGERERVDGRRVTLAAGAIGSPAILLRSGIGPKEDLFDRGIEPLDDHPESARI
jgi:NAD(P)-dependent dehydrogenase (short-subunit alcohol dehydrogenase family)